MSKIPGPLGPLLVCLLAACSGKSGDAASRGGSGAGAGAGVGGGGSSGGGTIFGGGMPAGGDGSGGATGSIDRDAACLADARQGEKVPIDLYLMVDKTGSMACHTGPGEGRNCPDDFSGNGPTRWEAVGKALEDFVKAPTNAGIGVGIGFFPKLRSPGGGADPACLSQCQDCACITNCGCMRCGTFGSFSFCADFGGGNLDDVSCSAGDYTMPEVEIAPLPSAAQGIIDAIGMQSPRGGTPTAASLRGAIDHAKAWALAHPDRKVALVYATDGEPEGCEDDHDIGPAVAEAMAAFGGSPSISTYVLGVGPSLDNLNQVAAAGGTASAYLVDTGKDVAQEVAAALDSIRSRALTCDYGIPKSTSGTLDFSLVNVQVTVGSGGTPTLIGQVSGPDACGTSSGWYYDNPAQPTLISLCKATCDPILGTPGSSLEVLIGCRTQSTVR